MVILKFGSVSMSENNLIAIQDFDYTLEPGESYPTERELSYALFQEIISVLQEVSLSLTKPGTMQ